ncbi:lipid IV(A) 3-deoxy-D-manno-octulosonic acid transferase [Neisseriaceae bacterium B1]
MQTLYHILLYIAAPLIRYYLRKRARKNPAYLEHWAERFGEPLPQAVRGAIWVHAVSVGETRAAQPLIAALQQQFPDAPLLITQMTPTGRATAEQLYPQAQCRYLPYDRSDWVHQFVREHQPKFGVLMETEIWPNLIHECAEQGVPLFLANARLSEKSQRGYLRVTSLIRPALAELTACFAQTQADASRLASLGAPEPQVLGNTKYDITPPDSATIQAQQFKQWIGERPVVVAASTRYHHQQDEAELILRAWQQYENPCNALLIIVPRHPERFQAAHDTAAQLGLRVQKRSENQTVVPETQIWIGDSMSEMFAYYQSADIAFVGGSLVDTGCQNIIEPMSCGKPVLFGYSTYNFQAACEGALQAGAAQQIQNAEQWRQVVHTWLTEPEICAQYGQAAQYFVAQHQGASARIAEKIVTEINLI